MTRKTLAARAPVLIALFAILLVTVALLACGGGDDDEQATESPAASPDTAAATATAMPEPASTPAPQATPDPTPAATTEPADPADTGPRQVGDVDGIVFQVGEGSEATFTVNEQLQQLSLPNDAVVRTTALSGHVSLDGGESAIHIDLHSLASDSSYRDRYIRQRMFPNSPTGTFTVQGLNELPDGFTDGDTVSAQIDGDLTIGSVTAPLTFDVEARDDGNAVYIHGTTTFTWDQLQLSEPIAGPVVSVDDEVRVEVLIAARPSGDSMAMEPTPTPVTAPPPADTPQPPAPASPPPGALPSAGILISPPTGGDPQQFLAQFPADESVCITAALPAGQMAALLGPAPNPEVIACLSDRTILRITLGGLLAVAGDLSPETESCLSAQLANDAMVGQAAAQFRQSMSSPGSEGPFALFALVPFMQCLSPEEAAAADLGDPAQIQCFIEELGPEGLAALNTLDAAAAPPPELFPALMKCGMGAGP